MAPKVIVPMDFGRHLRESPSHNNLKLNTSDGGEVCASSVILSFNSPVIDHMTTTLHMTSVDMLEFSEAAVQVFVDSAYSGKAEGITWKIFRDINKMANVFEVTWLVSKCYQHFTNLAKSVKSGSYKVQLFLFEEAGFVYENLKSKDFLSIAVKKIESLNCKQQFLERYLENAERLSTKELDTVIELAGNDVNFLVQTLVDQLSKIWKTQGPSLPVYCKYLLEKSSLHICQHTDRGLFDQLFDLLEKLPDEHIRWTLNLHRKSAQKMFVPPQSLRVLQPNETVSTAMSRCNTIPNMYCSWVKDMRDFDEFFLWLSERSNHMINLLTAFEALWTWGFVCRISGIELDVENYAELGRFFNSRLSRVAKKRNWALLPPQLNSYVFNVYINTIEIGNFDLRPLCHQPHTIESHITIESVELCRSPFDILSKETKLTFHFKHPSVNSCNRTGKCGFILKTVPSDEPLWKLRLCTKEADYLSESVHFHDHVIAENMHIFFVEYRSGLGYPS